MPSVALPQGLKIGVDSNSCLAPKLGPGVDSKSCPYLVLGLGVDSTALSFPSTRSCRGQQALSCALVLILGWTASPILYPRIRP